MTRDNFVTLFSIYWRSSRTIYYSNVNNDNDGTTQDDENTQVYGNMQNESVKTSPSTKTIIPPRKNTIIPFPIGPPF